MHPELKRKGKGKSRRVAGLDEDAEADGIDELGFLEIGAMECTPCRGDNGLHDCSLHTHVDSGVISTRCDSGVISTVCSVSDVTTGMKPKTSKEYLKTLHRLPSPTPTLSGKRLFRYLKYST